MMQQPLFSGGVPWRFRGRVGTSSARFSEDRRYRYELRRTWEPSRPTLLALLLNPSKSDEGSVDDATTKRLLSFADAWGCGSLVLANIFALMSTDPRALKLATKAGVDCIGPENEATIERLLTTHAGDRLLLGWGVHGSHLGRGRAVAAKALALHPRPECFALTQGGEPYHPLMLPDASVAHSYADLVRRRAA